MGATLGTVSNRTFWRGLAPRFHIADREFLGPGGEVDSVPGEGLARDGYVQIAGLELGADWPAMAALARKLTALSLDPVFAFVYDEFWRPYFRLDALLRRILGPYTFLPDFWAWNVEPGGAGWGAHRDRGHLALNADGSPLSLTVWIAISEATRENGCIHMVPKACDANYGSPLDNSWRFRDEDVRALPARPGDVLIWNQAVLHWGGEARADAAHSRVSMSFEVQRIDVPTQETPLIAPWHIVPFEERLVLIARKILHYKHMHKLTPELEALAQGLAA